MEKVTGLGHGSSTAVEHTPHNVVGSNPVGCWAFFFFFILLFIVLSKPRRGGEMCGEEQPGKENF